MQENKGDRLVTIADELRAIATNGLHWAANEYDMARYDRVMSLAAELLAAADTREPEEIARIFRGDLMVRTPFVGVDCAIFDSEARILLVQRTDNERWCMPGGLPEVGESPAQAAVRETREETGLRVSVLRLLSVYDSGMIRSPDAVQIYHLTFQCERIGGELTLTNETIAYGYYTEAEVLALPLHRAQGVRISNAFRFYRGEATECVFQ